jgi:hypothetical protein
VRRGGPFGGRARLTQGVREKLHRRNDAYREDRQRYQNFQQRESIPASHHRNLLAR